MSSSTDQTPAALSTIFPFFVTYRGTFFANGYIVEVQAMNGRTVGIQEADAFWLYGINPGGMAAQGPDLVRAQRAFSETLTNVLIDLAATADTFDAFKTAVGEFFDETNTGYEAEWHEATQRVQRGDIQLENMPVMPANSPRSLQVSLKRLTDVTAQDNHPNLHSLLAA